MTPDNRRLVKEIMLKYTEYKLVFLELPEEVSLAFSISSCPNLCRGCHSPELRNDIGTPIEECFKIIHKYRKHITAICLKMVLLFT